MRRQGRKDFITSKYVDKALVRRRCADNSERLRALYQAARNRDILALIQVYGEGVDLTEAFPQPQQHVRPSSHDLDGTLRPSGRTQ